MQDKQIKTLQNNITKRSDDYSQWYLDVIAAADLAEHAPVKGCMIIKPNGYAIWESVQAILDKKFKETGVKNAYFPIFIPESFLKKEKDHIEGFAPELSIVTHGGGEKLEENLVVRPTSETVMYAVFSNWIKSYRDLPLLINQWCNVVRWEKRTRLFLRTSEFLWQEGHTVHETEENAEERTLQMLEVYRDFAENYLAISVVDGQKSESEKFAGALRTYTIEAMMQDGKALQSGTSHNLGQNFAKAFDIRFSDKNNELVYAWQTSWGLSTRIIGAIIMSHSDDNGLVLPPKIASTQIVIVPVIKAEQDESLMEKVKEIAVKLTSSGMRVEIDTRDMRLGEKFFDTEKKGIPVRIEIGQRELESGVAVVYRRDTREKTKIEISKLDTEIFNLLEDIQSNLYARSKKLREENTVKIDDWNEFKSLFEKENKFVLSHWCMDEACEARIKEETKTTIRCIPFDQEEEEGKCILCGNKSNKRVLFGKAY